MSGRAFKIGCTAIGLIAILGACNKGGEQVTGEAGDPAAVDQVIEITASDELRFDPSEIEVSAGETIEFKIFNDGQSDHEFVLGPSHEHSDDMHHGDGNATGPIEPGASASVVWRFPEAGDTEFACHIAGHDEAGMTGTVTISG